MVGDMRASRSFDINMKPTTEICLAVFQVVFLLPTLSWAWASPVRYQPPFNSPAFKESQLPLELHGPDSTLIDLLNRLIAQAKMEQLTKSQETDTIPMVSGPDMDEAVAGITELEDFFRQRRTPESSSPLGSATASVAESGFHYPSFQKKKQNLRRMKELQKLHFQRMRREFDV